ncbi:MAG: hypothetical protein WC451_05650 [Patescibacteria group bacterium]
MRKLATEFLLGIVGALVATSPLWLLFLLVAIPSGADKVRPDVIWTIYRGQTLSYDVEIEEHRREGDEYTSRRVELHHKRCASYVGNTVWDYDSNGVWDEVFVGGHPSDSNGYNSFKRTKDGWVWSPCPADAGKLQPLPISVCVQAMRDADKAMTLVYNPKCFVQTLESYKREHKD